jgi:glycosyltransferase involved in cell wall biosynthesis
MKILFLCRSFDNMAGGIERMAAALMNEMCRRGHSVTLITWDRAGAKSFYPLDPKIEWHTLDLGSHRAKAGWKTRMLRLRKMRQLVEQTNPDIALAFQFGTFISTRLFTLGIGLPVIAAEREAPARFNHLKGKESKHLVYMGLCLAKKITIQCESYRNEYPLFLRNKIISIPNPVFAAKTFADPSGENAAQKTLLCVGRLSWQKNQAVLIRAFSKIAEQFPDWNLILAGEGEDRHSLESLISDLDLKQRISLPGAVQDTGKLYTASHLFCLPSRWEGFPNALAESLAHGLPAIGFSGCAGTRDLLRNGYNGLLAEGNDNPESLAETLSTLMQDNELRRKMGAAAIESVKKFEPVNIFSAWENLLKKEAKR